VSVLGVSTTEPDHPGAELGADTRRLNPDAAAALAPYAGSPLLDAGQLNLISLDAIATRPRWPVRRDAVHDYAARTLTRHLAEQGSFLRVSDTDFLVIMPGERKFAAQARCLRYLGEILTYFLGEAHPADLAVRCVSAIGAHGLEARLVDPAAVGVAAEREDREARAAEAASERGAPFTAADGTRVRVSCVLEPVFELKRFARIGNRIARRVIRMSDEVALSAVQLANLSRADIEKIDVATIARGVDRLRSQGQERELTLIIPVSFTSLSNRGSRAALAGLLGEAKALVETGVICEVRDIEAVPQTALVEATSLIKPYCMFLTGGLAAAPGPALANLKDTNLHALSFEAPAQVGGDAEFLGWAREAVTSAKRVVRSAMIYRVGTARQAGLAAMVGATHASLRPAATR